MCGIFGVVNGKHFRNVNMSLCNLVANGIVTNSVRGADSTGIMQMDHKDTMHYKAPISGGEFVRLGSAAGYINAADNSHFTVVHNRAATEGTVKTDNAHPFDHVGSANNYVIGVHNGTLKNWKVPGTKFEVDSDWALNELTEHGIDALRKFEGAYAFVWWDDAEPDVLQFARNAERPMYVLFVKGQNRMLFGSEYQMLVWLADRNNIALETEIIELAPNYHYKFFIDNPKMFTKQFYEAARSYNVTQGMYGGQMYGTSADTLVPARVRPLVRNIASLFADGATESATKEEAPVPYVTRQEVRMAKETGMFNVEVDFKMEAYDERNRALWGTCEDAFGELSAAVIRKVDKNMYDTWRVASSLTAKVWGAFDHDTSTDTSVVYVLSRKVEIVPEEKEEEDTPMGAAIKKSMQLFNEMKDKNNERNAQATVH